MVVKHITLSYGFGYWSGPVAAWIFWVLAVPFVAIRLYMRCIVPRKWRWSEAFTIFAFLSFTLYLVLLTKTMHDRVFWGEMKIDLEKFLLNVELYAITAYCTSFVIYSSKILVLLLFLEIVPRHAMHRLWWAVNALLAFTAACFVANIVLNSLSCYPRPLSSKWHLNELHKEACKYEYFRWMVYVPNSVMDMATDFMIYSIPFFLLKHIKRRSRREIFEIHFMFGVGFLLLIFTTLGMVCGLVNLFTTHNQSSEMKRMYFANQTYITIEMGMGLCIACLPMTKKFLSYRKFLKNPKADIELGIKPQAPIHESERERAGKLRRAWLNGTEKNSMRTQIEGNAKEQGDEIHGDDVAFASEEGSSSAGHAH